MDESAKSEQVTTRSPFWRNAIALPIGLLFVVVVVAMADSERGWVAALVVGIVWGGFLLVGALLQDRIATWRRHHALLAGCAIVLLETIVFTCVDSGPLWRSVLAGLATGLFIALTCELFWRRAARRTRERDGAFEPPALVS